MTQSNIATMPQKAESQTMNAVEFFDRFSNHEYNRLLFVLRNANVQMAVNRWFDRALMAGEVQIRGEAASKVQEVFKKHSVMSITRINETFPH